jgi:glycerophosphoryl diester phosphodiesterase
MQDFPLIIAHRGSSENLEENSLGAMEAAVQEGAQMLEMDVRVTKDQIMVLHHNNRLRLLKPNLKINTLTYNELETLGYKLPTLKDVLTKLPKHTLINLDLKDHTMDLALKALIATQNLEERVYFDTSNPFLLQRYQVFFPKASYVLSSVSPVDPLNLSQTFIGRAVIWSVTTLFSRIAGFQFRRKVNRSSFTEHVSLFRAYCRRQDVEYYHSVGIGVFVFTVNREKNMRKFIEMGVDGIKTDRPGELKRVIDDMKRERIEQS